MSQTPEHRLLLVHAHPDDESIGQGATMAKYVAEGRGVTLVTCTGGEMGEILVPELEHLAAHHHLEALALQLGEAPDAELVRAAEVGLRQHPDVLAELYAADFAAAARERERVAQAGAARQVAPRRLGERRREPQRGLRVAPRGGGLDRGQVRGEARQSWFWRLARAAASLTAGSRPRPLAA